MYVVKGTIRIKGQMFHTGDELPADALPKERIDRFVDAGFLSAGVKTEKGAAPKAGKAGKAGKKADEGTDEE